MAAATDRAGAGPRLRFPDDALAGWGDGRGLRALRRYSDAVNAALVARLGPLAGARVLKTDLFDEAVGDGLVPALRAAGARVLGVDVSAEVVAAARARYPDLDARRDDVRRLELPDGSVDAVVSNSTLDHFDSLDEAAEALAELRRVLAPGGALLLTLDNGDNPLVALRNALPQRLLRGAGLVHYALGATCGERGLRRLLAEAGLEVRETLAVMHCPRVLVRAAAQVAPGASVRAALALERLGAAPTRLRTGQFVAALARRP